MFFFSRLDRSKSILLELESKSDSDSTGSRSPTPTMTKSSIPTVTTMNTTIMKTPRIKRKLGRRLSYLIKDLQEVTSSSLPYSPSSTQSQRRQRAEIMLKKQPINGWGFSRWCYASIAIGRVAGLSGLTPLILYGTESLTPSSKVKFSPSRLISSCSKKSNRRTSSLQIVQTSDVATREAIEHEAKGSPINGLVVRPDSPTTAPPHNTLKLIDDVPMLDTISTKEDEDEIVFSSSKEGECFVTPKRAKQQTTSPSPTPKFSSTEAHRKYAVLVSLEYEIREMLRRIRSGDLRHLCVNVLNISNQRRKIYLSFRKYDDALCFFESALDAIVDSNVRNLCDAVIMNRKSVVELYTDLSDHESRKLAINITRKDRRSHTALDYATHYKDDDMIELLLEAAVLSCTSVAALAAMRAAKSAQVHADFAASLVGGGSELSQHLSGMSYIDEDGTVRTHENMNPRCFWF